MDDTKPNEFRTLRRDACGDLSDLPNRLKVSARRDPRAYVRYAERLLRGGRVEEQETDVEVRENQQKVYETISLIGTGRAMDNAIIVYDYLLATYPQLRGSISVGQTVPHSRRKTLKSDGDLDLLVQQVGHHLHNIDIQNVQKTDENGQKIDVEHIQKIDENVANIQKIDENVEKIHVEKMETDKMEVKTMDETKKTKDTKMTENDKKMTKNDKKMTQNNKQMTEHNHKINQNDPTPPTEPATPHESPDVICYLQLFITNSTPSVPLNPASNAAALPTAIRRRTEGRTKKPSANDPKTASPKKRVKKSKKNVSTNKWVLKDAPNAPSVLAAA